METPWEQLPARIRETLLFGSGDTVIEFAYFDGRGGMTKRKHRFEGVIPNLERRWRETDSSWVRDELSRF